MKLVRPADGLDIRALVLNHRTSLYTVRIRRHWLDMARAQEVTTGTTDKHGAKLSLHDLTTLIPIAPETGFEPRLISDAICPPGQPFVRFIITQAHTASLGGP